MKDNAFQNNQETRSTTEKCREGIITKKDLNVLILTTLSWLQMENLTDARLAAFSVIDHEIAEGPTFHADIVEKSVT
jgi:hypothetical protein